MYRVIWKLSNGLRRYSSSKGVPELWTKQEIEILKLSLKKNGSAGFTEDFSIFSPSALRLRQMGYKNIIETKDFDIEDSSLPISKDVLI